MGSTSLMVRKTIRKFLHFIVITTVTYCGCIYSYKLYVKEDNCLKEKYESESTELKHTIQSEYLFLPLLKEILILINWEIENKTKDTVILNIENPTLLFRFEGKELNYIEKYLLKNKLTVVKIAPYQKEKLSFESSRFVEYKDPLLYENLEYSAKGEFEFWVEKIKIGKDILKMRPIHFIPEKILESYYHLRPKGKIYNFAAAEILVGNKVGNVTLLRILLPTKIPKVLIGTSIFERVFFWKDRESKTLFPFYFYIIPHFFCVRKYRPAISPLYLSISGTGWAFNNNYLKIGCGGCFSTGFLSLGIESGVIEIGDFKKWSIYGGITINLLGIWLRKETFDGYKLPQ